MRFVRFGSLVAIVCKRCGVLAAFNGWSDYDAIFDEVAEPPRCHDCDLAMSFVFEAVDVTPRARTRKKR